jgi:2',3'-cyclic-nucleotide 2'-phosphodiesterase
VKFLFIGDVVGRMGRAITKEVIGRLKEENKIDITIVNGENAAAGVGITKKICEEFHSMGIDVITSGNHIWDKREILEDITGCPNLIRPANYPEGVPGVGSKVFQAKDGSKFAVFNLIGRVFMPAVDDPFKVADKIVEKVRAETPIIIADFHGEATSEKNALAWYLDGRVSAVIGTHTHVQTSDERILPKGTAFITDAGMVGALNSIIGVQKETIIKRFLTGLPERFEPELTGPGLFNGLVLDIDASGRTKAIKRINMVVENVKMENNTNQKAT